LRAASTPSLRRSWTRSSRIPWVRTRSLKRKRSVTNPSDAGGEAATEEASSQVESSQAAPSKRSHKKGKSLQSTSTTPKPKAQGPQQGIITLGEGESLAGGTLVWAKMDSYPWWAAVVWEEDTKGVPMNVLRSKGDIPRSEPGPLTLVQFYDKARSWQWLELSCLRLLGEDKEMDSLLLTGRGKIQTFRTPRLRQGCRQAYRQAMAEMEGPEGETNEGTTNPSMEPSASVEPMQQVNGPDGIQQELRPTTSSPAQPLPAQLPEPASPAKDDHMKDEPMTEGISNLTGDLTPPPETGGQQPTALSSELSDIDSDS